MLEPERREPELPERERVELAELPLFELFGRFELLELARERDVVEPLLPPERAPPEREPPERPEPEDERERL